MARGKSKPQSKPKALARHRSMFFAIRQRSEPELEAWLAEVERLKKQAALRRRPRMVDIVEHIPAERVEVSRERHRELTERAWIGPTQTNTLTGEVTHLRRTLQADGRFVTERLDGPAPTPSFESSTAGSGCPVPPASCGNAIPPDDAPAVETASQEPS